MDKTELSSAMEDFLNQLEKLLSEYEATIVRSANSTHDLVISLPVYGCDGQVVEWHEIHLTEELTDSDIKYRRFKEDNRVRQLFNPHK